MEPTHLAFSIYTVGYADAIMPYSSKMQLHFEAVATMEAVREDIPKTCNHPQFALLPVLSDVGGDC